MPTTLGFKDIIDLPEWRPLANALGVSAAGACICSDQRNNEDRHPEIFLLRSQVLLDKYNVKNDEWINLASPALQAAIAAGEACVFVPHMGPQGLIGAGCTNQSIVISTALPAAVALNQLANRSDGRGFKIRIIGNSAGGSGLTEERLMVGNTGGTTPTIYLDSALTFVPANGDRYEILSGRVYLLSAGAIGAATWKYYDIATNSYTAQSQVNLPATIGTDSCLLSLSESHVPYDRAPGDGFFGNLTATGSGVASLTGQAIGGDIVVLAGEYRNFQIRIVQDVVIPTAVGQRRRITTHTAGPSPVYTVVAWAVVPSADAIYVIENDSDKILLWSSAVTTTFNFNIAANTWDTVTWAVRPSVMAVGCCAEQSYGIEPDAQRSQRHSYIYSIRGGAVSTIDLFDIAGAATGLWTGNIDYGNKGGTLFGAGTCTAYDGATKNGAYFYINISGTQRFTRFCMTTRMLEGYAYLEYAQGTAIAGDALCQTTYIDGTTKVAFIIFQRRSGAEVFQLLIQR